MALTEDGRIAVGRTLALGWSDIWRNWKLGLLLMLAPQLLISGVDAIMFRPGVYGPGQHMSGLGVLGVIVLYLAMWLVISGFYILFIRLFLLGREHVFHLSARDLTVYSLRFIFYSIVVFLLMISTLMVLMLMLMIPMFAIAAVLGMASGPPDPQSPATVVVGTLIVLAITLGIIVLSVMAVIRFYPTFFGIAIGQKVRLREAWRSMTGYTFRTFLALLPPGILMYVPAFVFSAILVPRMRTDPLATYHMMGDMWWVSLVLIPFVYLVYAWSVAILSHIYRDLWPAPEGLFEEPDQPSV